MKYDYDAITKCILKPALRLEFFITLAEIAGKEIDFSTYVSHAVMPAMLERATEKAFKETLGYVMSKDHVQRAIAAFNGPAATFRQSTLEKWAKIADKMSGVEKVMSNWPEEYC